ncbi:MAG TPA: polysulfide reductase NrfD, partial [bacterium]|nr:polysulfide reductase NrfD [bacterium]
VRIPEAFSNRIHLFDKFSERIHAHPYLIKNIGVLNMIVGAILGIYTGVLLSGLAARPLWNSSMLWILFLTSGISAAAAFVHLVTTDSVEREISAKADNAFLIFELFVITLFIVGMLSSAQAQQTAARLILNGPYASVFWVFVVGCGIIIPLIIQLLAVNHKIQHTPIAPIMVMLGGLILRFVIVYAGQASHWTIVH